MTQTFEQASASSALNESSAKCLHICYKFEHLIFFFKTEEECMYIESKPISPPGLITRRCVLVEYPVHVISVAVIMVVVKLGLFHLAFVVH